MSKATEPTAAAVKESYRGVFDTQIPGFGPVIWSAVEASNIEVQNTNPITVGPLWVLLYVFTRTDIHLLTPGKGTLVLEPGTAVLIPPGAKYRVDTCVAGKRARHAWLLADGIDKTPLFAMVQNTRHAAVFHDPDHVLGTQFAGLIDAADQHKAEPFWVMQAYGIRVLDAMAGATLESAGFFQITATSDQRKPDPLVGRVIEYLEQNIAAGIRLTDMARHLHASASTISHRYRAYTGQTPMQTLKRMRMIRSKIMLLRGLRITDIAHQLGFYDEHHFSLSFKAAEGVSPTTFVKRMQNT